MWCQVYFISLIIDRITAGSATGYPTSSAQITRRSVSHESPDRLPDQGCNRDNLQLRPVFIFLELLYPLRRPREHSRERDSLSRTLQEQAMRRRDRWTE